MIALKCYLYELIHFFFCFLGEQLHSLFSGPVITTAIALPTPFATSILQQHVNDTFKHLPGFTPIPIANPVQFLSQSGANIMQQQLIQGQVSLYIYIFFFL